MKKFPYYIVGNRYKKDGTVHVKPYIIAGFMSQTDAYDFQSRLQKVMPTHNIRVIGVYR